MSKFGTPLICYDIGARGQLQDVWHELALKNDPDYNFVLVEPDHSAANELRHIYANNPRVKVVEKAALHKNGKFDLHVARHATCSSLLRPNMSILSKYNIAPIFETVRTVEVECARLDEIISNGALPAPDYIKIDVQGVEHLVLIGLGKLLSSCLAVELETHMYSIYEGQKTIGEIVSLLQDFGLYLCDLRPQRHFEYDFVEANAVFCRHEHGDMSSSEKEKLQAIRSACGVEFHPQGTWIKKSL